MVQLRTIEKLKARSGEIAREAGTNPEVAIKIMDVIKEKIKNRWRKPRQPIPEGSISLRAASRKYHIPPANVSRWYREGKLKLVLKTANWIYIQEKSLVDYLNNKKRFILTTK